MARAKTTIKTLSTLSTANGLTMGARNPLQTKPTLSASGASTTAKNAAPQMISTLVHGIVHGLRGLASVLFGLSLAALGTFFLLKDGQQMRRWVDRHVGLPEPVAYTISGAVITSLRGYFRGVTVVAAFNGVVVGLAAVPPLALGGWWRWTAAAALAAVAFALPPGAAAGCVAAEPKASRRDGWFRSRAEARRSGSP